MKKLRVRWIPQVGMGQVFYVPVNTVEEGKKLLDILAAYDMFQLQNDVKPDFCNTGGLQMYDDDSQEWEDWYFATEYSYYDDVDTFCESDDCKQAEELKKFSKELFSQIDFDKLHTV